MSTLRSGLDELRADDLNDLTDDELDGRLGELARAKRVVEAEFARTVAEIERRGSFAAEGHLSMVSFVEARLGVGWSEASREVRVARALEDMPAVRAALAEGEVSSAAVGLLVAAREAAPEEFPAAEESLLDAARSLPARGLRRAVEHWRALVDPLVAARDDRERFERRGLNVAPTVDGMVRVDGNLDPETGGTFMATLRAVTDAWSRTGVDDGRSAPQRRADALGEVCRRWLDRSDRPVVSGERPHVTVVMDLQALEAKAGRRCDLDDAGRISPESALRIACDASVSRVITGPAGQPLEVGRATRLVPPALRRALVVRDGGCAFPVCDRPASWCDAHHVVHWADGGRTDLDNLVLMCRRHHRMIHSGFGVAMDDGRPVFRRADGTILEGRAPP